MDRERHGDQGEGGRRSPDAAGVGRTVPTRRDTRLLRMMTVIVWFMVGTACAGGAGEDSAVQDTLTRRERDSLIGGSRLPGARGVRGAMRAADAAAERAALADSISGNP